MNNEYKMKLAFTNRYLQPIKYDESFEKSRKDFESGWKACAAIKDAEIAEARKTAEYWKSEHLTGNAEIAARDLMIKELREVLHNMLEQFTKSPSTLQDSDARVKAHKALANSEHHNSRALEKS